MCQHVALAADISHCLDVFNHFPSPPWQLHTPRKCIATTVPGITGQADDIDLKRWCSLTIIASHQPGYTIYTDGSASGGTRNRCAAALVTRGSPIQPGVVTTIKNQRKNIHQLLWGGSSCHWVSMILDIRQCYPVIFQSLYCCTDSRSLCEALISTNPGTSSICPISLTPSCLPFSFNRSLVILPFQVTN